jgi:hypothetical protein
MEVAVPANFAMLWLPRSIIPGVGHEFALSGQRSRTQGAHVSRQRSLFILSTMSGLLCLATVVFVGSNLLFGGRHSAAYSAAIKDQHGSTPMLGIESRSAIGAVACLPMAGLSDAQSLLSRKPEVDAAIWLANDAMADHALAGRLESINSGSRCV